MERSLFLYVRLNNFSIATRIFYCFCLLLLSNFALASVKVDIKGIDGELRENVELKLSLKSKNQNISRASLNRLIRKADKEVKQALQPFGYYSPSLQSSVSRATANGFKLTTEFLKADKHSSSKNSDDIHWLVELNIEKGPQVKVDLVSVIIQAEGKVELILQEILDKNEIHPGDGLDHRKYKTLKSALLDTAYNTGYLDAGYTLSELRVDVKKNKAFIFLTLDVGELYYFGPITIHQDELSEKVMQRYTRLYEGKPFDSDSLLDLKFALSGGGYFSGVDVNIKKEEAINNHIPLEIDTSPAARFSYTGSVGWGTETGVRVGTGFQNRRVNKLGHKLQSNIRLSEKENSFVTQYKIPVGNMVSEYYDVKFNATEESVNDVDSVRYAASGSRNKEFMNGLINYNLAVVQDQFQFTGEPEKRAEMLIPGITYTYAKADNPLYTRKGYSFSVDIHGGVETVYSETTFLHLSVSGNIVFPLFDRGRVLLRGEQGRVITDDFELLPPSERFFAGGVSTVRGYGYRDISPTNSEGVKLGGNTLVVGSVEADYLFANGMGAAIFFDSGTATNDEDYELHSGVGIGFRYNTPIGLLRIDLAHPLDKLNKDDDDFKIHFNIGPDI